MRVIALIGACLLFLLAFLQGEADSRGWFTIVNVEVKGNLQYGSMQNVHSAYSELIGKSLLLTPVVEILTITRKPEWISETKVRKIWPNKIQVEIKEYTPLAYWRNDQIITALGNVIKPKILVDLNLPHIIGPKGTSDLVLEQFRLISQVLALANLKIKTLELKDRGTWDVRFTNDLLVRLGKDEILERLQRFIAVYKTDLSGRINEVESVDARYSHGVAVTWKQKEN